MAGDGLKNELEARGIALQCAAPELQLSSETDFYALSQHAQDNPVDAVVCGFSYQWDFATLSYMSLLLQHHEQCEFVATSGDVSVPLRTVPLAPGAARRPSLDLGVMPTRCSYLAVPGHLRCSNPRRANAPLYSASPHLNLLSTCSDITMSN